MSTYTKSIVASGHQLVSRAAADILQEGGNAFDAVVAAGFAAAIVEPTLTSLGGGGLLLGWSARHGQELFFDFFVDTPGIGRKSLPIDPDFFPITVTFSGTAQDFNVGLGSVAVPGKLKGLIHVQEQLGRMDLSEVLSPARDLAASHIISERQGHFLDLLYPIMTLTPEGRALYEPGGQYLKAGDEMCNRLFVEFLDQIAEDRGESFYCGEIAEKICREMQEGNGLLTREDLARYEVKERKPLKIPYRKNILLTSPEPSMGGALIGLSIALMQKLGPYEGRWGDGGYLCRTVGLMQEVERVRDTGVITPEQLQMFLADETRPAASAEAVRQFSRGTTHISVSDRDGNCASMTCSNGEGSGYFAPDTGVMLNNMMGEDDLHPGGFHSSPPGIRVGSMMSPSLLIKDDKPVLVIGSGGSKRIRTAISQVLSQVVDFGCELEDAVQAPRLYWDGSEVQIEPGFSGDALESLREMVEVNLWSRQDVYFGGVHAVIPGICGAGDKRRGGSVVEI